MDSISKPLANRNHLLFSKCCVAISLAACLASFGNAIGSVVHVGPQEQMGGIATRRVVAFVQHSEFSRIAIGQYPSGSVGSGLFVSAAAAPDDENSIASTVLAFLPQPTFVFAGLGNAIPEPIGNARIGFENFGDGHRTTALEANDFLELAHDGTANDAQSFRLFFGDSFLKNAASLQQAADAGFIKTEASAKSGDVFASNVKCADFGFLFFGEFVLLSRPDIGSTTLDQVADCGLSDAELLCQFSDAATCFVQPNDFCLLFNREFVARMACGHGFAPIQQVVSRAEQTHPHAFSARFILQPSAQLTINHEVSHAA